ncbi:pyruvate ferredoxin oxidoreductase [Desulfoprunum benzoelyticum]|uniref:Pyruvate ferredoxin oxidoreductase alpha subunit n=1 Tax=Desulfoprunum benzoelyticum TaxID=1506996 RepID=A0A840UU69_9BACT|nr:pyruvate ferredoxin oxidoreductase [Desulfoprunum benzoelyticum]MBB5349235.1 pyruvate ferredoxin oxidoreductase alpha subunit [Desulfoprunum benzoelyticum]MBM9530834.1 pyruvate ferredoxin oxidoreductase [Desulfoprunum benzoelyticum]
MHIIESGNVAAATGVKLSRVQVIAAYPITPQTPLTEKLSEFVESEQLTAQYIPVESEHSAMAVCIAASTAGTRAFTATSANGLLYMNEQLHWAVGARLPIVTCVVNRGIGAPWTVWNDQQDSMAQRDVGWIQLYASDHQQIIDSVIKAFRLAQTVSIPVMVCYDGYLLSHTYMPFDLPEQSEVDAFLPPFVPKHFLDPENPGNFNTVTLPDVRPGVDGTMRPGYIEIRHNLHQDLRAALDSYAEIDREFEQRFGRGGSPFVEQYRCDDARFVAVAVGSLSYQLRDVIDTMREDGIAIGVMGVQMYRPFPDQAVASALAGKECVIVFEKALSYGNQGPLYSDIKSTLYRMDDRPIIHNYILGLGGREIKTQQLLDALTESCARPAAIEDTPRWIGLKLQEEHHG